MTTRPDVAVRGGAHRKPIHLAAHFPGVNHNTVWSDPAARSQVEFESFAYLARAAERALERLEAVVAAADVVITHRGTAVVAQNAREERSMGSKARSVVVIGDTVMPATIGLDMLSSQEGRGADTLSSWHR